jgi:hypothetical protein
LRAVRIKAKKMRNWLKTALFISAFSPCLISIALARMWDRGPTMDAAYYAFAGFIGILFVRYVVDAIRWKGESFPFVAKKVEANDALMLGVIVTYFLPFLGKAADITFGVVLAIMAVVCLAMWVSTSILPNPVLRLLNYRFYKAESASGVVYTLITQRELLDPKDIRKPVSAHQEVCPRGERRDDRKPDQYPQAG